MSFRRMIRETVENGINTLEELQASLRTAIALEFSTIPPYLCAQWSIVDGTDRDSVGSIIGGVAAQEMLHFGLVCNMYTATGGSLKGEIATPELVPAYPITGLPGGVHPGLVVTLAPLGAGALRTFMSIEYPESGPVVPQPPTPPPPLAPTAPAIGQFYEAIAAGFTAVFPTGSLPRDPSPNQVVTTVDADGLFAVNAVADALRAVSEITTQGEGSSTSPDDGAFDPGSFAHYYSFAEIYYGRKLVPVGAGFAYSGDAIALPDAHAFAPDPAHDPDQQAFIDEFTTVMNELEACWTSGSSIDAAIGRMFTLKQAGLTLITTGTTPPFTLPANGDPMGA
ncbi:conserved hypothetical protein [Frankia canadensis]|uniref:Iminophenyl-pyruvate dimer synthase domain-containing protein n=1 Tax=Frankia canadensis TaxID=1836972 RepID=A0A2I2KI51_9ACTN|nr:ferritin-like protein [Frankia canadensis]SNQ45345.1 conserved hypothetical protein [Frankia canadensis]SOU52635.1 conserved hypothetical protein [Frankia canadensis]